jgi:hypothetical protein
VITEDFVVTLCEVILGSMFLAKIEELVKLPGVASYWDLFVRDVRHTLMDRFVNRRGSRFHAKGP